MTTPVTVATCNIEPFSTNCKGNDIFDGVRTALLGACTNGVPDDEDFSCGTNGGFSADEFMCINNPFTDVSSGVDCGALFTALGDSTTLKSAQDNLIMACTTGADIATNTRCESGIAGDGQSCLSCLSQSFYVTGVDL